MGLYFLYKTITLLMLLWFTYELSFGSELRYLIGSGVLAIINFMILLKKEFDEDLKELCESKSVENLTDVKS